MTGCVTGCEAVGCDRPADWAYIGEGGDLYLCAFHGGTEPVEGWVTLPRHPVFEGVPSALDIAHWFKETYYAGQFRNVGGDAVWLSREPHGTLHHLAMVDHDDQDFHLLDIGTNDTSDLLFVTCGLNKSLACEWRNQPSERQPWDYDGLIWFAGMIEAYERTWGIERRPDDASPEVSE